MNKNYLRRYRLAAVLSLSLVLVSGCSFGGVTLSRYSGNGNVESKEVTLTDGEYTLLVKDIHFYNHQGRAMITIHEDLDPQIVVKTDENILDTISIAVDESAKSITVQGDKKHRYDITSFNIEMGSPVNSIQIDGGFSVDLDLPSVSDFAMVINGAIEGNLLFGSLSTLSLEINGASNLKLEGECVKSTAIINGASNIQAYDFITEDSSIDLSGASNYQVHVTGILDAKINGIGSITYTGSPATVNKNIRGLGSIGQR